MYEKDIYTSFDEDKKDYLNDKILYNLHKKSKSILNDFDYSINHLEKAIFLEEKKINENKTLSRFSFYDDLDICIKYNNILQNKLKISKNITEKSTFQKMSRDDLSCILENFGLYATNNQFSFLLTKLYSGSNFFFFLPPSTPLNILKWKDLKNSVFTGQIKEIKYLFKNKEYIPIISIKDNESNLKFYTLDYFLTVWDYSIQLISGFFREVEKDKVFINNKEYKKNQFLPSFVTNKRFFHDSECKIKSILGSSIEVTNGIISFQIKIEDLERFQCNELKEINIGKIKLRSGMSFFMNPFSDSETIKIKRILKHINGDFITITFLRNSEEIILKDTNFNDLYLYIEQCNYSKGIIRKYDTFEFSYIGEPNIMVKIKDLFQNLSSEKYFIQITQKTQGITLEESDFFELSIFEELLEDKNKDNYKYKIEYNDILVVDNVFFTTDFLEESNKQDILLSYTSAFGKIAFYSNKKILFAEDNNILYKNKIEFSMFRLRKGVSFSLVDTSNKYLSYAAKTPVISALTEEEYSSEKIKKEIQINLEKIKKENLINSEGSMLIMNHTNNKLSITHSGNSIVFLNNDEGVIYKKNIYINNFGEITNGIGSKKSLQFYLERDIVNVNAGNQLTIISDGFPVRVEVDSNEILLKGIFLGYNLEKLILRANKLPLEKRHLIFISIVKLNKLFEDMIFELLNNYPRTNFTREQAYEVSRLFREVCFSPISFFLKIIRFFHSDKNSFLYNKISTRIENPNKNKVITFIVDGILKTLHISIPEEEKDTIKNFFHKSNLMPFYEELRGLIYNLKSYKNNNKFHFNQNTKSHNYVAKITEEQRIIMLKSLNILIDFFENIDSDIKNELYNILNEIYTIDSAQSNITYYWRKKINLFDSLHITKEKLWANQNSIKKENVLDLEPLIKKFLVCELYSDDFTMFFYDIERTNYDKSLVCDKNNFDSLVSNLDTNNMGIIENDDILKIKDFLLYHPKITKIQNYTRDKSKNISELEKIMLTNQNKNTRFFSRENMSDIYKKLGINR